MSQITIDVPDASISGLTLSPQALAVEMKMAAAARLYALGRMTMHQAALFAGIDEFTFRQRLGDYGVSVFTLTREELAAELA
jgi:hypothetical protein